MDLKGKGNFILPPPLNLTHYFLKMDLGIMVCIPLLPSTIWVTLKSTARLDRASLLLILESERQAFEKGLPGSLT